MEQRQIIDNLDVAEEREVFILNPSGNYGKTDRYKAIYNLSKNELGCIASQRYNLIQHKEVVNSLFKSLNNLNLEFESNLREHNHSIFLDISFPNIKIYFKEVGEEFITGLRLINSYDKTTGLLIIPKVERLACSNGMVISSFVKGFSIRHNQVLSKNFEGIIEKSVKNIINSSEILKKLINECISDIIEWKLTEKIMQRLIKTKKHIGGIFQKLEKRENITRWDLYNAITEYATHGEQLNPNIENWLQKKSQELMKTKFEDFLEVKIR